MNREQLDHAIRAACQIIEQLEVIEGVAEILLLLHLLRPTPTHPSLSAPLWRTTKRHTSQQSKTLK